jgi:predicted MPP superfamily phosphohydrolase
MVTRAARLPPRAARALRRATGPRARRLAALALVAGVGGSIGWALAPDATTEVGPLTVRVGVSLLGEHPAEIDLPPVGEVGFDSHRGPVGLEASVESVDVAAAEDLLGSPTALTDLAGTAPDAVRGAVLRALAWTGGCTLAGAGLAAGTVFRSRRRGLQGVAAAGAPLLVCAAVAGATFEPSALDEPRFTGLLSRAPYLAGEGRSVVDRLESYRSGVADMVRSVTTLYTAADELPVIDDDEVTTVLHISDIHLSPQGYDLAQQLVEQFGVDVVVDTGDVTTWGTAAESATLNRIGRLGVPYVFVRGNHDSVITANAVAAQGASVLEGEAVTVGGLTFAGIGDARFSPDSGELDIDAARRSAGETAADLAAVIGSTNRSGEDVDVALIHDPSRLDPLLGEVPLVLSGHYHSRTVRLDGSGTRVMVQGSTGGAGISAGALDRLAEGEPLPLQASLLYFGTTGDQAGRLVAWDDVSVGGLGLSSVEIDRTLVQPDEEPTPVEEPADPAEPSDGASTGPSTSPGGTAGTSSPATSAGLPRLRPAAS